MLKLDHVGTDSEPFTLKLNGHQITGMLYLNESNVVLNGGIGAQFGTLAYTAEAFGKLDESIRNELMGVNDASIPDEEAGAVVINRNSKLLLENIKVEAMGIYALVNYGSISTVTCLINGGYLRGDGEVISVKNGGKLYYEETEVSAWTLLTRDEASSVEIGIGITVLNGQNMNDYQGTTYTASSDLSSTGLILADF